MMLHLITQRLGSALALDVASIFVYDQTHSATDIQPVVFSGGSRPAIPVWLRRSA